MTRGDMAGIRWFAALAVMLAAGSSLAQGSWRDRAGPVPASLLARRTEPPGLRGGAGGTPADAEGVVLLDEQVIAVEPSGSATVLVHRVLRPLERAGLWRASKIVTLFRSRSENVAVLEAHRITAAGELVPLPADAVFVQTPQPLAEEHVYTDLAQLVILFPGIQPGDTVDYTLVKHERAVIPGEFSAFLPVADPWPSARARREVLLPSAWTERLQATVLGLDAAERRREVLEQGAVAVSWSMDWLPALRLERGRQPIRQGGPGIWLSTVRGWPEVAAWYGGLLDEAGVLGRDLERSVEVWTRGLTAPRDILAALQRRVTARVHYLGLEFGARNVRPRSAAEVWSSGFGDCKEIANLLRAMLEIRGVRCHLVLVNTQHAGHIHARVPTPLQFDHAILAVEDGGRLFYCDPAAAGLAPGELPPGVGGRPALLVDPVGGRLVRLPPAPAGRLKLDYDLAFTPPGHVQGWLRAGADSYQGRLLLGRIRRSSDENPADLGSLLAGFFNELEVLETAPDEIANRGLPSTATLFLRAPVSCEPNGAGLQIPASDVLLPPIGEDEQRETPYYQHLGSVSITVRYAVPQGWEVVGPLPAPLDVDSNGLRIEARWEHGSGGLKGVMRYETTLAVVDPAGYVGCARGVRSLRAWLGAPVQVRPAASASVRAAQPALPRLATGAAQLRLVEEMFPRDGPAEPRREALQQVQSWFAGDPATALEAGLEIAALDQGQGRSAASVEDLRGLLERFGASVGPELRGWAEYLLASGLRRCGSSEEAQAIYDRLSRDTALPASRRGWAYARAAQMRVATGPPEALAILDEAVRLESPALEQQVSLLAELELTGAPGADLQRRLDEITALYPHRSLDIHARLVHEVRDRLDHGDFSGGARLAEVLEQRAARCPELKTLAVEIRRTGGLVRRGLACHQIAGEMSDYVADHPPAWWAALPVPANGRDALVATLQRMDSFGGGREFVRGTFALLTHFSVAPDFFEFLLRRSAEHLRRAGGDDELVARLDAWRARLLSVEASDGSDKEAKP